MSPEVRIAWMRTSGSSKSWGLDFEFQILSEYEIVFVEKMSSNNESKDSKAQVHDLINRRVRIDVVSVSCAKLQLFEFSTFRFSKFQFLVWKKIWKLFSKFFFAKFFWSWKNIFWKKFLPMSTQNFLRIPKIVLRKPCDEPKHAKTSTLVFFVYLKHRKYPPSDHPRTSSDPGYSGGIRSYGALFFHKTLDKTWIVLQDGVSDWPRVFSGG